MKTLSYIHGKRREIVKGESYYFGELWDGNGDADYIFDGKGEGVVWVDSDDGESSFVDFKYDVLNTSELLDTTVTVTDIF